MIIQKEFPSELLETMIAIEIFLIGMDKNVMGFRFGRFEYFVTDFASGRMKEWGLAEVRSVDGLIKMSLLTD